MVAGAPGFDRAPLLRPEEVTRAADGTVRIARREVPGDEGPARLLATPAGERVAVVGTFLEERDEPLAELDTLLLAGIPVALLVAALAGYAVAGRALRPVERMRARAEEIRAEHLAQRLPVPGADDEVRRLAETLNAMLDAPPGGLRARALIRRRREPRAPHPARPAARRARARAPPRPLPRRAPRRGRVRRRGDPPPHAPVGGPPRRRPRRPGPPPRPPRAARRRRAPAHVADRFDDRVSVDAAHLALSADPLRVEQALGNLVDNALRHGGGEVELRAARENGAVALHVLDRGPGLPPALDGRAFARFTRGDEARQGDGAGLGLAIVGAIANAHGGDAGIDARPGGGADAWIRLPL